MRILAFFLLLSCLSLSQSDLRKNPLDFVFVGDCPSEYETCLPYSRLSFRPELLAVSDEAAVQRMNDFVSRHHDIFLRPVEVYRLDQRPRNFGLRMKEPVKKREAYLNVSFAYTVSNEDIDYGLLFPTLSDRAFPKLPSFNDSYYRLGDRTGYQPDAFRFIANFLFHMYRLNESRLADSLVGLPLDFSTAPIMSMIPPEFTIFKESEVNQVTLMFRKETFEALEYFNDALEATWSKAERKLFFNGRVKISMDDFAYSFYVMRTRGLSFAKQRKIVMIPVHFAAKNNDKVLRDNDDRYLGQMIDFHYRIDVSPESNESSDVAALADHNFEKDEPVVLNYKTGNTLDMFLFLGFVPKKNPNECYEYQLFHEQNLRDLKLSIPRCARVKDLKRAYLIGNLINMNDQETLDCREKTSKVERNSDEFFKLLDEDCVHPKWNKKTDIWINPLNTLEDTQEKLEAMQTTVVDYTGYRSSKKLPCENGDLIREYIESKLQLTRDFQKEIKELRKYGKRKQKEGLKRRTEL